ncbi:MAG: class I tRNA ligase family protein, partial [Alphaproteobacteria bacterium]|nr:class I tRNA ligase family protein [Alphaproteobacteria bacterium]
RVDSPRRRAARTVLDELFSCLTAWLAPILCFTAEEAWLVRYPGAESSVHLCQFPALPPEWRDDGLVAKWQTIRRLRRVITGALEVERRAKRIGSSLQAHPEVYAGADYVAALDGESLAEIAITSGVTLIEEAPPEGAFALDDVPGVGVVAGRAEGTRCARCWQVLAEVGEQPGSPDLCRRCVDAVENAPG